MTHENGERPITPKGLQLVMAFLIPLLALAVSWGVWTTRIDSLECRLAEQTTKLERYDATLLTIQVQLAEIQKDLTYIRKQVDAGSVP